MQLDLAALLSHDIRHAFLQYGRASVSHSRPQSWHSTRSDMSACAACRPVCTTEIGRLALKYEGLASKVWHGLLPVLWLSQPTCAVAGAAHICPRNECSHMLSCIHLPPVLCIYKLHSPHYPADMSIPRRIFCV